jgi:hypothetical protein
MTAGTVPWAGFFTLWAVKWTQGIVGCKEWRNGPLTRHGESEILLSGPLGTVFALRYTESISEPVPELTRLSSVWAKMPRPL